MHSLWLTGRLLSRAFINGISNISTATDANPSVQRTTDLHLVSAVSGYAKEKRLQRLIKGQYGDDAWFTAKYKTAEVLGVADGVGGWRAYGIDPGEFSYQLMRTCERLVKLGRLVPTNPSDLLARSYCELLQQKKTILGSSTACVVVLNRENNTLYTANIGDSGFMVVRRGKLIHRSEEQQHYFNTPFQLSLPPPAYEADVLSDQPDSASTENFPVEDGDVILVATDGVFDNVPQKYLVSELSKVQGERCPTRIQVVADAIASKAHSLSIDEDFLSPFAESAFANGINTIGGKPDDITVLLATVAI